VVVAIGFWHGQSMRWWLAVTVVTSALLASGGSCGDGATCECFPCGATAISVFVVDSDGAAFGGDWTLEASLDGVPVDTTLCDPGARAGANTCGVGVEAGTYQMVLRTPTAEKSFTARLAGRAGQDCCTTCIASDTIQVELP
jgi:hypothetical protein